MDSRKHGHGDDEPTPWVFTAADPALRDLAHGSDELTPPISAAASPMLRKMVSYQKPGFEIISFIILVLAVNVFVKFFPYPAIGLGLAGGLWMIVLGAGREEWLRTFGKSRRKNFSDNKDVFFVQSVIFTVLWAGLVGVGEEIPILSPGFKAYILGGLSACSLPFFLKVKRFVTR